MADTNIKVTRGGQVYYVACADDRDALTKVHAYARRFWDARSLEDYRTMMTDGRTKFRPLPTDSIEVVEAADRGY